MPPTTLNSEEPVILTSVSEILICWSFTGYLHKDIRIIIVSQLGKMEKTLWRLRSFFVDILGKLIIRLTFATFSVVIFFGFLGQVFQNGISEGGSSVLYLLWVTFIFVFSVAVYLLSFFLRVAVRSAYIDDITEYSLEFVPVDFSNQYDIQNIKYLFVAYIYCLMLKIDEYYSDYKSEIRVIESKAAGEESLGLNLT